MVSCEISLRPIHWFLENHRFADEVPLLVAELGVLPSRLAPARRSVLHPPPRREVADENDWFWLLKLNGIDSRSIIWISYSYIHILIHALCFFCLIVRILWSDAFELWHFQLARSSWIPWWRNFCTPTRMWSRCIWPCFQSMGYIGDTCKGNKIIGICDRDGIMGYIPNHFSIIGGYAKWCFFPLETWWSSLKTGHLNDLNIHSRERLVCTKASLF